jgi:hypothetical protein
MIGNIETTMRQLQHEMAKARDMQAELEKGVASLRALQRQSVQIIRDPQSFLRWSPEHTAAMFGYVVVVGEEGEARAVAATSDRIVDDAHNAWAEREPELATQRPKARVIVGESF